MRRVTYNVTGHKKCKYIASIRYLAKGVGINIASQYNAVRDPDDTYYVTVVYTECVDGFVYQSNSRETVKDKESAGDLIWTIIRER